MKSTLIAFLLLISQLTFAQIPEPGKNTYINDYAGVLTPAQISNLNQGISDLEKLHQVQLAVVLVDNIPSEYTIKQFAVQIGKQWHIGKDERGVVYVAAIAQHKQHIEVGEGLASIFSPEQSQDIMKELKSSFKKKDYKAGLDILIDDINNAVPIVSAAQQQQAQASQPQQNAGESSVGNNNPDTSIVPGLIVFAAVIAVVVIIIVRSRKKRIAVTNPQNPMDYPGYYDVPPVNNGYGQPGYYQQPDHTLRDIATGVAVGAAAAYVADSLLSDQNNDNYAQQFDNNNNVGFDTNVGDDNSSFDDSSSSQRNDTSSWGDWGGGSSDSSGDSGFSGSSDSGGSSDW